MTKSSNLANSVNPSSISGDNLIDDSVPGSKLENQSVDNAKIAASAGITADKLSYNYGVTGASTRQVESKLKERVTPADFGATGDGTTNDTAAFTLLESNYEGGFVDLQGKTYSVTAEPRGAMYYNGSFKVGSDYIYKEYCETPFGKLGQKVIVGDYDRRVGVEASIAEVEISPGRKKWVQLYRRASGHELINGAQIVAVESYDSGMTWINPKIAYSNINYDTRNGCGGAMGNNRIGALLSRRDSTGTYINPIFLYSDDLGRTWSTTEIAIPNLAKQNFHGQLMSYPASVGGHDTLGWIGFAYGGRDISAYVTTDNGNTWTFVEDVATPDVNSIGQPGIVYSLSECAVARIGTEDKWVMTMRNADPSGSGDSNLVAYKSTNLLTWSGPYDTGIYNGRNPPNLVYEGGKLWAIVASRRNREVVPGLSSHFLIAAAPANALFSNNVNFAALNANWRILTQVPDWNIGYMRVARLENSWYGISDVEELSCCGSSGPKRSLLTMFGNFVPPSMGANEVLQLTTRPNEIVNGMFQIWRGGTSFSVTGSSAVETADNWWAAAAGTETTLAERYSIPLGQTQVPGNPKYAMRLSGTAAATETHFISARMPDVTRFSETTINFSFWAKSLSGDSQISSVKFSQFFGTGGGSPTYNTERLVNLDIGSEWRFFTVTFPIESIAGKTVGTGGDDYLDVKIFAPSGTYDFVVANAKFENGNIPTPILTKSYEEELSRLPITRAGETYDALSGTISLPERDFPMSLILTSGSSPSATLNTINGGQFGQIVIIGTATSSISITLADAAGNLQLAGNCTLATARDRIVLAKGPVGWYELSRSLNG